jgi:hypothetical protein
MNGRSLLAVGMALAGAPGAAAQRPAWAELDSVVVGGPVDVVFALGMVCRPGNAAVSEGMDPLAVTAMAFGNAFAHSHETPEASRRALEHATVCVGRIWNDRAFCVVLAIQRRIGALSVVYAFRRDSIPVDSVRRRIRSRWGRGDGNDALEEWWHDRYRAYLLNAPGPWGRRVVSFDVRACTAFDRLLHQAGEPGKATPC